MNKTLRSSLIALALIVGAAALVLVGMVFGRSWWNPMGYGMMSSFGARGEAQQSYGLGPVMMGFYGQNGPGMMGALGVPGAQPLSLAEAEEALQAYLGAFPDASLSVGEIMIFDNHAYAQLVEESSGIGAMEVLIDPVTKAVSPEFGPNMMWNLKYSPMAGSGMMGMMSGFGFSPWGGGMMGGQTPDDPPVEMPVGEAEAVRNAQRFLDAYLPGAEADEEADRFYGYYTLHVNQDGSTVGMLSVNGYTGEVFLHTWHGNLIEMSGAHE